MGKELMRTKFVHIHIQMHAYRRALALRPSHAYTLTPHKAFESFYILYVLAHLHIKINDLVGASLRSVGAVTEHTCTQSTHSQRPSR